MKKKINTRAPWYRSPEFSCDPSKDIQLLTDLGYCENCIHLEITKGVEFSAVQCLQPDRMKEGLGTSIKHACRYRTVKPLYNKQPDGLWIWRCPHCEQTYPPYDPPIQSGVAICHKCGGFRPLEKAKLS